jgi:hypothetical protein
MKSKDGYIAIGIVFRKPGPQRTGPYRIIEMAGKSFYFTKYSVRPWLRLLTSTNSTSLSGSTGIKTSFLSCFLP